MQTIKYTDFLYILAEYINNIIKINKQKTKENFQKSAESIIIFCVCQDWGSFIVYK